MYYFEYDKKGYLYKYKENLKESEDFHCLCYCYVSNDTVIKIEDDGKFKSIIKYTTPIKIIHRFEAGESWLSTQLKEDEEEVLIETKDDENIDGIKIEDVYRKYPQFYEKSKKDTKILKDYFKFKNTYPIVLKQINLENDSIYNLKIKIQNSLIEKWTKISSF